MFRESDQSSPDSAVPPFRENADGLNVAHESAFHVENRESGYLTLEHSQIDFPRGIGQHFERVIVSAVQGNPWLAAGHDLCASLRFRGILEFPEFNVLLHGLEQNL
jgi:hypothetical protein